jgi:hypothetical protein
MADNVAITPGAGATIATDDVGGFQYQRVKVAFGADGSATDTSATTPFPVGLADRVATGTIAALNGTVSLAVDELSNAAFHITGSFVARFRFEKTVDGTNWEPCYAYVASQNDLSPPYMPWDENWSNNIFLVLCAGAAQVRVIATGYTSGTITVTIRGEGAASHVQLSAPPTSPYLTVYDDFEGAALDALTWEVVTNTITSATVSGSNLTLATGTAVGKYTLLSRQFFGPGMRASVYMSLSQRIANQRFRIELVSITETGAADEENIAGIEFTGTTATAATRRNRAQNGTDDTAALTITTSATISAFGIELYDSKIVLTQTTTAGVTTQIGFAIVKVPDPNRKYKLRIEAENTGVAGSNTNMVIGHARFQSIVKVPTEIVLSGLNASAANNAIPVNTIYGSGTTPASQSGTWTVQPGNTANTTAWLQTLRPSTSGGLTIYRKLATGDTNSANIKGGAGQVYGVTITNTAAAVRFVKLYNKATAPTVGTDTPVITIAIPANGIVQWQTGVGIAFATGIGIGMTTGVADADTGALTANDVICNLFYS